jgi:hypothetical protein
MKRLLSFLWSGCWHEWVDEKREAVTFVSDYSPDVSGYRVFQKCKKCGDTRVKRLM